MNMVFTVCERNLQGLEADLRRLHLDVQAAPPEVLEQQQHEEEHQAAKDELARSKAFQEMALADVQGKVEVHKQALSEAQAQLQARNQELAEAEAVLRSAEGGLEQKQQAFEDNKARQQQLYTDLQALFTPDEQVEEFESLKERTVAKVLELLSGPASQLQSKRVEQEIAKATGEVDEHLAELSIKQAEQQSLRSQMSALQETIQTHSLKENQQMRVIVDCQRALHLCAAEEAVVSGTLAEITEARTVEAALQRCQEEATLIESQEKQLSEANIEVEVIRRAIQATRDVLLQNQVGLWKSKTELHVALQQYADKLDGLQEMKGKQDTFLATQTAVLNALAASRREAEACSRSAQQRKAQEEEVKEIERAIAEGKNLIVEKHRLVERAQDLVDLASSDLTRNPKSAACRQMLDKCQQRLEDAQAVQAQAEHRVQQLQQDKENLEQALAGHGPRIQQAQLSCLEGKQEISVLEAQMQDLKKQLITWKNKVIECNSIKSLLESTVHQEEVAVLSGRKDLMGHLQRLAQKCTDRLELHSDLTLRKLLSAQLVLRTELLSARVDRLKTRLTQFAPLTKEHRKLMNETTAKLTQCRQKLTAVSQQQSKLRDRLCVVNYEVYLMERQVKIDWVKLKLLSKDYMDAKEHAAQEAQQTIMDRNAVQQTGASTASARAELEALGARLAADKHEISHAVEGLAKPMRRVLTAKAGVEESQEGLNVCESLLPGLQAWVTELESSVAELSARLDTCT